MADIKSQFLKVIEPDKKQINQCMIDFFEKKLVEAKENNLSPTNIQMIKDLKEYCSRDSKKVRPFLMIQGFEANTIVNDKTNIIKAAISLELLHDYFLVHDDILDEDDLRRGKPSFHKIYEERFGSEKVGINFGILGGDFLQSFGMEAVWDTNFSSALKLAASKKYAKINDITIHGQVLDVVNGYKGLGKVTEVDVLQVYLCKTARYTFEGPLQMGAILAGASQEEIDALSKFAIPAGILFQIYDDYLDIYGKGRDREGKKNLYGDFKEGKMTLFVVKAYELADKKTKAEIKALVGKPDLTKEEGDLLAKYIMNTGAADYARKLWQEKLVEATEALEHIKFKNPEVKQNLKLIITYILSR